MAALVLVSGGCSKPAEDTLVFSIHTAPASLHPLLATDAVSERINELLYRPLVSFDTAEQPVPGLVRWSTINPQHYELRLHGQAPAFSDGTSLSLDDVRASLRFARDNPASPHATTLKHIKSIQQKGDRLSLRLSRPDPRLPEKLHLGVAPRVALRDATQLGRQPIGNGSFRFLRWMEDGGVLLQRRKDAQKVRFAVVPDPTMRALKLQRGETHLLQNDLPYEMYELFRHEPSIRQQSTPGTTFSYLGFNLDDPFTGDLRVRQAIAHAIDREAIVSHLFRGYARPANTLLAPGHWAAHEQLPDYAHDPQRAMALLAESGYGPERPLRLSYKTSTDPFRLRIASVIQAQLKEVGIELRIQSNEWGTFFGDIKAGRFQMYSLSWVGIRSPDIFRHVFHSDSLPPGGANRGRYRSDEVDHLIDRADRLEQGRALPLYFRIQERIHQDLVYVPLWHEDNLLLSRGVNQAAPASNGSYLFLQEVSLRHE